MTVEQRFFIDVDATPEEVDELVGWLGSVVPEPEPLSEHLSGKHDQKSHGKGGGGESSTAARPNSGALARGTGGGPHLGVDPEAPGTAKLRTVMAGGQVTGTYYNARAAKEAGVQRVGEKLANDPDFEAGKQGNLHYEVQGRGTSGGGVPTPRDDYDKPLAELIRSDKARQYVDGAQKSWAESSGDNDPVAVAMQYAAKGSVAPGGNTRHLPGLDDEAGFDAPGGLLSARAYHRARYADTQAVLSAAGLKPTDTVTLYRGTGRFEGSTREIQTTPGGLGSGTGQVALAPLSSWSTNAGTASAFGSVLMAADFPVSRLYGVAATGHGCLNENEVVVTGGTGDSVAFVVTE